MENGDVLWGRFDQSFFRVWGRFDHFGDVLTRGRFDLHPKKDTTVIPVCWESSKFYTIVDWSIVVIFGAAFEPGRGLSTKTTEKRTS